MVTFSQLRADCDKMIRTRMSDMAHAVDDILDRARINASDTLTENTNIDPADWDKLALASVESILCERDHNLVSEYSKSKPATVRKWFERRGVRY